MAVSRPRLGMRLTLRGAFPRSTGIEPRSCASQRVTSFTSTTWCRTAVRFVARDGWRISSPAMMNGRHPSPREVGPERGVVGDRLVQLHRPTQPDAVRVQNGEGRRLRDPSARQDARSNLPDRLDRARRRLRPRRGSTATTSADCWRRWETTTCFGGRRLSDCSWSVATRTFCPGWLRSCETDRSHLAARHALAVIQGLVGFSARRHSGRCNAALQVGPQIHLAGGSAVGTGRAAADGRVGTGLLLASGSLNHPDPHVRLDALLALGDMPDSSAGEPWP